MNPADAKVFIFDQHFESLAPFITNELIENGFRAENIVSSKSHLLDATAEIAQQLPDVVIAGHFILDPTPNTPTQLLLTEGALHAPVRFLYGATTSSTCPPTESVLQEFALSGVIIINNVDTGVGAFASEVTRRVLALPSAAPQIPVSGAGGRGAPGMQPCA